jgi:hypothetical protein
MTPSLSCIRPILLIFAPMLLIWLAQRRWQLWQRARLTGLAMAVWLLSLLPVAHMGFAAAIMALAAGGRADLAGVRYAGLIQEAAEAHGLDPALIAAVVEQESNFDPGAISPVGAMGLMQIMPATAAELGLLEPFDAAANLDAGTKYLASLIDRYGDVSLALAAYNAGPGRVDACQCIPQNGETPGYVARVIAAAVRYRHPDNSPILPYGPDVTPRLTDDNPNPVPFKGQDWATPCGTPLYAPITGVVTAVGFDGYQGRYGSNNSYIIFDDGAGTEVILLHGRYIAQVGQPDQRGQTLIGYEASIGNSTGCHTDYSIRK